MGLSFDTRIIGAAHHSCFGEAKMQANSIGIGWTEFVNYEKEQIETGGFGR
jgi:hypothetical protein